MTHTMPACFPFGYMNRWKDAGFLTTSDHLGNTTSDGGLEDHRGIHTAFNIGYMFFRKSALPLVQEWRQVIRSDPRNKWDQVHNLSTSPPLLPTSLSSHLSTSPHFSPHLLTSLHISPTSPHISSHLPHISPTSPHISSHLSTSPPRCQGEFNRLARTEWKPHRSDGLSDQRLFWAYRNQVIGGVLPLSLFCGGHNYFVSQLAQRNGWKAYSIHTTYQYAAAAGKRHRLREAGVWMDPPEYYDPPGGLLSFALDVPPALVHPTSGMSSQGHITLIKYQLRQLRSALALAHALGRKLVLPSVTCGYDKYWGPLWRGVIPGTHTWALPITPSRGMLTRPLALGDTWQVRMRGSSPSKIAPSTISLRWACSTQ